MNKLTKILTLLLILFSSAMSAVLFEVKSSSGSKIMEVCDDGVRFYDPSTGELLSEISATNIEFKTNSGKLRDFAVSDIGNSSKGSTGKLLKLSNQASMSGMGDSMIVFYKPKNAFRTNSIIQDETLVGDGSFAAGYLNQASGEHSTAFGAYNKATGPRSTAIGGSCNASGETSFATGSYNTASGSNSFAAGQSVVADGVCSIAMGSNSMAFGSSSVAFGSGNEASGNSSAVFGDLNKSEGTSATASGQSTTASGQNSFSTGMNTFAIGFQSFTMGTSSRASGENSVAMGYASEARAYSSLVLGRYNTLVGNPVEWVSTDPIFSIGNGTSNTARSNAFEVKKNGNTYIPSLYTTIGSGKYVLVDSNGKLGTTDVMPKEQNQELENLKSENSDLKARVAKLETLMEQMLNK